MTLPCYYLFLFLLLSTICSTLAYESCTTRKNGYCVPVNLCHDINLLKTKFPNENVYEHLLDPVCNSDDYEELHLCCNSIVNTSSDYKSPTFYSGNDFEDYLNPNGVAILNDTRKCGLASSVRIAYGRNATDNFVWMAALMYSFSEDNRFKCGGSLITNRYVLTAAHCCRNSLYGVRLGSYDLTANQTCSNNAKKNCKAPEDFGIENYTTHPLFNQKTLTHDVGLIKLNDTVEFKDHIKPICLPFQEISFTWKNILDDEFLVAGWGRTESGKPSNVLQITLLTHMDRERCGNFFQKNYGQRISETHICAGENEASDTCKGDSGGPIFKIAPYKRRGRSLIHRYIQFGIVSYGASGCGRNNFTGSVYANVVELMPWITNNID